MTQGLILYIGVGSKETQTKLFLLEQIKEVVFHRDTSIIPDIVHEVVNNFMIEKPIAIKKFLIKFSSQALRTNSYSIYTVSPFISLIDYFISSDVQDNLLQMIVTEINNNFVDILTSISEMPLKAKTTTTNISSLAQTNDPKYLWNKFHSYIDYFLSIISSDRSDNLRTECLKFTETVILFGLPPPPKITDPRLARAMRNELESNPNKSNKNAEDIPLHHAFINRNDLIQEAEDLYSKMLLWTSKNGPSGFPFGTALVSLLGQIIASGQFPQFIFIILFN